MSDTSKETREAQLARIRGLMAKTVDNGCTEAEARSAAAAVDRLLALYEIDLTEVTVKEQEIVQLLVKIGEHSVRVAARDIGRFTDTKVWTVHNRDIVYFGFKVDTEIAEYLTLVFKRAIDGEVSQFTMFNAEWALLNHAGQRDLILSFSMGMATRLGERLIELKSKRDFTQKAGGRDLVAIKKPLIDEAFAALGIELGKASAGRSIRNTGAYVAGRTAAESVSIHQGVAARAANSSRLK